MHDLPQLHDDELLNAIAHRSKLLAFASGDGDDGVPFSSGRTVPSSVGRLARDRRVAPGAQSLSAAIPTVSSRRVAAHFAFTAADAQPVGCGTADVNSKDLKRVTMMLFEQFSLKSRHCNKLVEASWI